MDKLPNVSILMPTYQRSHFIGLTLDNFINQKRKLSNMYEEFFKNTEYAFVKEPKECKSNYWLNSVILKNKQQRDKFLSETNSQNIMTRPIWTLMNKLPMFESSQCGDLKNSEWLEDRTVNIPSSLIL